MKIADFVFVDNQYGIGKIVSIEQDKIGVEFFVNIGEQVIDRYRRDELEVVYLGIQTRVYIALDDGSWRIGRVVDFDDTHNPQMDYEIQFPNQKRDWVETSRLKCRSLLSLSDPTEVLGNSGGETQYLYESRKRVLEKLTNLRASSKGLTAVTSASIELVIHQINIAQKILTDPICRYLLSDEVGMGKTIEAGVIARQILLDSPNSTVLIIVPKHLIDKWQREMEERFYLDDFGSRVEIITPYEVKFSSNTPELIIVDEAHHIIGNNRTYSDVVRQKIISMAKKSEKLLLLSATPSIGNEHILLRLLQTLDPLVFGHETIEKFKEKLDNQSKYSKFLRILKVGQSPFLLKRTLSKVMTTFPNDDFAKLLADKILKDIKEKKNSYHNEIIKLKSHLIETWQLHNRLIRSRRIDLDEDDSWMFQDRGEKKDGLYSQRNISIIVHPSHTFEKINEKIEEWRSYLVHSSSQKYIKLLEYSNGNFDTFRELVDEYIEESLDKREKELLENLLEVTSDYNVIEFMATIGQKIEQFLDMISPTSQGIIFVSDRVLAKEYFEVLVNLLGERKVLLFDGDMPHQEIRVVICDQKSEEGVDFQFADAIIHLDLPLDPSRIEQRIGRLDRFGRAKSRRIQHLILLPTDSEFYPWGSWYKLLFNGFGVFNTPISDIQLKLKDITDELHNALFIYGVDGLENYFDTNGDRVRSTTEYIYQTITKEREALDEQYALNYLSLQESDSLRLRDEIEESEYPEKEIQEVIDSWLFNILRFYKWHQNSKTFEIKWKSSKKTLLPKHLFWSKTKPLHSPMWEKIFSYSVDRELTYFRDEAVKNPHASLVRVGHPLFLALHDYLNWEDRGTAFSTFRVVDDSFPIFIPRGEIKIFFKLHYIVEASISKDNGTASLYRRRIDSYLPPEIVTIYINEALKTVRDEEIIEILNQPFNDKIDTNLGSRRYIIDHFIDNQNLLKFCKEVSLNARNILQSNQNFIDKHQKALSKVKSDIFNRTSALKRRVTLQKELNPHIDTSEYNKTILFEESLLDGITHPIIRLDAFGMFFISRFPISKMDIIDE
jgi:ATP-dependent helicase HepA